MNQTFSRVRAKMYVSAINRTQSGNHESLGVRPSASVVIHLNCVYSPNPDTENHSFFKATPNGTGRFIFFEPIQADKTADFTAGRSYYVDFIRDDEDGEFRLESSERMDDALRVVFTSDPFSPFGENDYAKSVKRLEYWINNQAVWPFFEGEAPRFRVVLTPCFVTEGA